MSSRCRGYYPAPRNPLYVPVYTPRCAVDPVNNDPKRMEPYCPPVASRSEPLSHYEYLRKLKANAGGAISGGANLLQVGPDKYKTTIWTATQTVGTGLDTVLPAVPPVKQFGDANDAGLLTEMRGANAGRGTISQLDLTNRTAEITTLRVKGTAIASDDSFGASAGVLSTRTLCPNCHLLGTTQLNPGTGCNC